MQDQLSLSIRLLEDTTFDNWYVGHNYELLASLQNLLTTENWGYMFLWGAKGTGKSHLLQAACQAVNNHGQQSFYLPFSQEKFDPEILENLAELSLICIDDVELIAQNKMWEEALFHLFNRLQANSARLLVAGSSAPTAITFDLADLKSRLASGMTYQIKPLNDDQKLAMLQLRADLRGFALSNDVGRYLLSHFSRDIAELLNVLDVLDKASLQAKHRLTIPFVKSILNV